MEETRGLPVGKPSPEGRRTMVGQTVGQYRVLGKIGRGGMSVVYSAEDVDLHRKVAVKFISTRLTADEAAKQRFIQEARAASALDHQNICTIHQIGETDDGRLYLVMAYYQGETVGQKIRRGPISVEDALGVVYQVANGLSRAHESGIVHRDIKPGNIMVTDRDEVKILDFGIAKLAREGAEMELTQPGTVLGTAAYMSPEQASGREVNDQTDIWALGVVLFEMLAGERPFQGPHPAGIIHSILYDDLPEAALPADLAPGVRRVLHRALAKERSHRYARMKELMTDLGRLLQDGGADPVGLLPPTQAFPNVNRSIVVLPFANLSPDRDSDYFSDGLTDELITDLSNIRALRVISRTSTNRLKESQDDLRSIARSLNVQYVLEGGVRRAGESLRVTAKLIDATTDSLLWADKYSGTMEDVFAIQESLSRKIVEALKVTLSVEEDRALAEHPITDVEAYEFYLRGKQEVHRYSEEALDRALVYLQNGLKIAPENALMISALGQVYWQFVNAGISSDSMYLQKAEECAQKVFEIEPDSPHGNRLLGIIRIHQGQCLEGVRLLQKALATSPNDTDTLAFLTTCYGFMGRPSAGRPLTRRLLEVDPLTPIYQCWPGILSLMDGRFSEALGYFMKSFRMDPSNPMVRCIHGQVLAMAEQRERGLEVFESLRRDMPENFFAKLSELYCYALAGKVDKARELVDEELSAVARTDPFYSWNLAECFALLGEKEAALEWLRQAHNNGFYNYPLLAEKDPFLESLRGDEAFDALLLEVKESWEAFEV
ncbi:MAG: protein kinase [Acidobacteriota bacterium]